jgi:acetaldehyde dehydrogenase
VAERLRVAIIGSGNIGSDLMAKVGRSEALELVGMAGIDPDSPGLARAAEAGITTSSVGLDDLLSRIDGVDLAFDATSAYAHAEHAATLEERGILSVDLTPAALGPPVIPAVNLDSHRAAPDVNLVTCGAQATVPVVAAIARVTDVPYAEIVSTIAAKSAGPGTRANIDEFTQSTARSLELVGGAARGKAIILLNPADPPVLMRNAIYADVPNADQDAVIAAVDEVVARVAGYVPGYRLTAPTIVNDDVVTVLLEVERAVD